LTQRRRPCPWRGLAARGGDVVEGTTVILQDAPPNFHHELANLRETIAGYDAKREANGGPGLSNADEIAVRQALTQQRLLENEERRLREEYEDLEESEFPSGPGAIQASADVPPAASIIRTCSAPEGGGLEESPAPSKLNRAITCPSKLEVRVQGMSGQMCTLSASRAWRVAELKAKVEAATRIPKEQQCLYLGNQELDDADLLADVTPPASPSAYVTFVRQDPVRLQWREMLSISGMQLAVAPSEIREQRDLVLLAVMQNGRALEYASPELRADSTVVLAAVSSQGMALEFAAPGLRGNREVVITAVRGQGEALQFASDALRNDREVALCAVPPSRGAAFKFASKDLRDDRDSVLEAVSLAGLALEFASWTLKADRNVVLMAVRENGLALEYASEELRSDRHVVLEAIQMNALAILDAAGELRTDPELLAVAKGST